MLLYWGLAMRSLTGVLGGMVVVGLLAGEVGAVGRDGAVRRRIEPQFLPSLDFQAQPHTPLELEFPRELWAQGGEGSEALVFEGELSEESQVFSSDGTFFNIHTFTGQAGETIKIDLVSDEFDTLLLLLDPDGNNIAQNDDGGENKNARIVITLPADGEYSIVANSYQAGEVGRYQITLQGATAKDEANHEIALQAAQLFQEGQSLRREGSLESLQAAIEKWEAAIPLYQQVGDRGGEAATLTNIGGVYNSLGEKSRALEYFNQALPLLRAVGDRSGEANTLTNIGAVYNSLGEKSRALEYYNQALPLLRAVGNRSGEATTLNNIGAVYDDLGEKSRALEYYNQALPLRRAVGDRGGEAVTLNNIGQVYNSIGEKSRALEYFNQALPLWEAVGDISGEALTLGNVADTQRDEGQLTAALENIQAAIELVERLRSNITSSDLRQTYFAQQQGYYQFYTDLLMQLHQQQPTEGYDAQAFHVSERSRARTLIELLTESQLDFRSTADNPQLQPLLDQEQTLLAQLRAQEQRLAQRLRTAQTDPERDQIRQDYTTATDTINTQLDRLITQIKRQNPAYTDLKYPEPLTLEQIQTQLLDEDTVLLQYSLHPDQSYLWVISNNSYTTHILPPQDEINQTARRFHRTIQTNSGDCSTARNPEDCIQRTLGQVQSYGQPLYDQILAPVAAQIQGKRLLIVPDGILHQTPFAAIPIPPAAPTPLARGLKTIPPFLRGARGDQYTPLVTQHEIIHAPSATAITTQRQNLQDRPPAPKQLAILADPVFSANDPRITGETFAQASSQPTNLSDSLASLQSRTALDRSGCIPRGGISRLPGTRREAETLQTFAPDALTVLDFDANQTWIDTAPLDQYRSIFFSTHGCIDNENPELSGLVLTLFDKSGEEKADGFLRLNEIFGLKLNADLVVLSACQTGRGETVSGEGMVGMTRGFMYAGAERVVVSLWDVSDDATAELMGQFYGDIEAGKTTAQALHAAQLQLWEKYQDPRLWAAFTLQGDWR
ncbi:CHAT domain-containing protein [Spirulina sp.]|uniref:CHAT domain-containing protein n=1 Tax=Spirulina sp. TaxID=1157 RepID=UPI003F6F939A